METTVVLALSVLLTSWISGVVGMAGGMILMGVLGLLLSPAEALVVHGVIQAWANGSRSFMGWRRIAWQPLRDFFAATLLTASILATVQFSPSRPLLFLSLGALPILASVLSKKLNLSIQTKSGAYSAGVVVTAAQLTAGVSGPLLDLFYVNSRLTRHEIIPTKAFTQMIHHLLKTGFFLFALKRSPGEILSISTWGILIVFSVFGTALGTRTLHHLNEMQFRSLSRILILVLAIVFLLRGTFDLIR